MTMNGQSKVEFQKNYKRVRDIINKSGGDKEVQVYLSKRQANLITDEHKCINRAMAAKEIGNEEIFEVFFRRAYELGSVGAQVYRDYVISKLLE